MSGRRQVRRILSDCSLNCGSPVVSEKPRAGRATPGCVPTARHILTDSFGRMWLSAALNSATSSSATSL